MRACLCVLFLLHGCLWTLCSSKCAVTPTNGHVTIPSSWTNISRSAFYGCTSLTSVEVGSNVKFIGEYAFGECPNLYMVDLAPGLESIRNFSFKDSTGLSAISFPDTLTEVGNGAFDGALLLQTVVLGGNIEKVGNLAFSNCKSLTNVTVGNSVKVMGVGVFSGCDQITTASIGSGLADLSYSLFYGCSKLKTVTISLFSNLALVSNAAFLGCKVLAEINLPSTVTSIAEKAFSGCGSLKSILIGDAVTEIGSKAFSDCRSLEMLALGKSVTKIHSSAFERTYALKNVSVPRDGSLEVIGDNAFSFSAVSDMVIPATVKHVGAGAFSFCPHLTSVVFQSSNMTFGANPFFQSSGLKAENVWYPNSLVRFQSLTSTSGIPEGSAFANLVCDSSLGCFCDSTTGSSLNDDNYYYFNCVTCPVGTFSNRSVGTRTCDNCQRGSYNAEEGQSECTLCPAGSACENDGMVTYKYCQEGSYSTKEGSSVCDDCSPGYYQPSSGATDCSMCESGSFAPGFGAAACVSCEDGKYTDFSGTSACMDCAPNSFTNASMDPKILCTPCQRGYWTDGQIGSKECVLETSSCAPGKGRDAKTNLCTPCAVGGYSTFGSSTSCDVCPPGRWSDGTGVTECLLCPKGYSCSKPGMTNPLECQVGTYSATLGTKTDCTRCASDSFQNTTGSTSCKPCPSDSTNNTDSTGCIQSSGGSGDGGGGGGDGGGGGGGDGSSSSSDSGAAAGMFTGGSAIYGSFLIAFVFVGAAAYMQHLREDMMNRLGDMSRLKAGTKSMMTGFIFASEWFLIAAIWGYDSGLAGTMLFFRLACHIFGAALLLYCSSDAILPKKFKKRVEYLIPPRGAFTAETNPLFDEVNHGFVTLNTHFYYCMLFLTCLEISMAQFHPWIKSKFFKKSGGFPTLGAFHFVFCVNAVQRMMSVVCQIAFLGSDERNDGKANNGEAKALFGLCIFCSILEVLIQGFVLLTKHSALEELDAEASKALTKERKSVRASRVSLTAIYAAKILGDDDLGRLSGSSDALHENPMHFAAGSAKPGASLPDEENAEGGHGKEDNERVEDEENDDGGDTHGDGTLKTSPPVPPEEVEEPRESMQDVPL